MKNTDTKVIYSNPFFTRGFRKTPDSETPQQNYKCSCTKLDVHDWLSDIEPGPAGGHEEFVEVRFKNSKKDFYKLTYGNKLNVGDIVAVESNPGRNWNYYAYR